MKTYETKTREEQVCTKMICDLCGFQSPSAGSWPSRDPDDYYYTGNTTVEFRDGHFYGDGEGSGLEFKADICPTCFKEKVMPALANLGCGVKIQEWDY